MTAAVEVLCCLFGLYGVSVEYRRDAVIATAIDSRVVAAELGWAAVDDGKGRAEVRCCGAAARYKAPRPWGHVEAGVLFEFRGRVTLSVFAPGTPAGQSYSEVRLFPAWGR